jgi:hypothetical protein
MAHKTVYFNSTVSAVQIMGKYSEKGGMLLVET